MDALGVAASTMTLCACAWDVYKKVQAMRTTGSEIHKLMEEVNILTNVILDDPIQSCFATILISSIDSGNNSDSHFG